MLTHYVGRHAIKVVSAVGTFFLQPPCFCWALYTDYQVATQVLAQVLKKLKNPLCPHSSHLIISME